MAKKLILVGIVLLAVGTIGNLAYAQGVPAANENFNITACSDVLKPFSVRADLTPELDQTLAGAQMKFNATVTNDNDSPVVDGAVYVKIFQKQSSQSKTALNGDFLVDQFFAKEGIALDAKGSNTFDFSWPVPAWAAAGDYSIYSYFISAKKFNLGGITFTDNISSGRATFKIESDFKNGVMLDRNNAKLNDKPYAFVNSAAVFSKDEKVTAKIPVQNQTAAKQDVEITYTLYSWDGILDSGKIDTKTENISLAAGEKKTLSYEISDSKHPVYYLVVKTKWNDALSIADIRFSRDGVGAGKIYAPALVNFPLKKSGGNTLATCVYNSGSGTMKGRLDVALLDGAGAKIKGYTYSGDLAEKLTGLKADLALSKDYDNFQVKMSLFDDKDSLLDEATLKFDCNQINKSKCFEQSGASAAPTPGAGSGSGFNIIYLYVAIGIVIILGGLGIVIKRKKSQLTYTSSAGSATPPASSSTSNNNSDITFRSTGMKLLLAVLVSTLLIFGGVTKKAEAKSVTISGSYGPQTLSFKDGATTIQQAVNNDYQFTYNAYVKWVGSGMDIPPNVVVTVGDTIAFYYKQSDFAAGGANTAYWFEKDYANKVHTGTWINDPFRYPYASQNTCKIADNLTGTNIYLPLAVAIPSSASTTYNIRIDTSAAEAAGLLGGCVDSPNKSQRSCGVMKAGLITVDMVFGQTNSGHFVNYNPTIFCMNEGQSNLKTVDMPAQTITFNLRAVAPPPPPTQCSDGVDNDGDGKIDAADPGCHTDGNASNSTSYDPSKNSEIDPPPPPKCNNNGQCEPALGETTANCPSDCPATPPPPTCNNNNICEPALGETTANCPNDCKVIPPTCNNNGQCEAALGETTASCPSDCPATPPPICNNNNTCEPVLGETTVNCPNDCKVSQNPQCSDNIDNDGDGKIDAADPGCHTDGDAANPTTYDPNDNDETDVTRPPGGGSGYVIPPPIVRGPSNGKPGVAYTFTAESPAVGAPGNKYRYLFYWNRGSIYVPTDWVLAGTSASATFTWSSAGRTKSFAVKTVDSNNVESLPSIVYFNITADGSPGACTPSTITTACSASCGGGTKITYTTNASCSTNTSTETCNTQPCRRGNIIKEVPPGGGG